MATGPPSSAGGASTSTKLQTQNDLTQYLLMLENDCNVRLPREDSIMYQMQEAEELPVDLAEEMALWEGKLKLSEQLDVSEPRLLIFRNCLREFRALDANLRPEDSWTPSLLRLFDEILSDPRVSASTLQKSTHRDVFRILDISEEIPLSRVMPDFTIGLKRTTILVAPSAQRIAEAAYSGDVVNFEYSLRHHEHIEILYNLPHDEYSEIWYPWILGELKAALGPPGKGRLQNLTACMLSLDIVFHLAQKARSADPDSFRYPTATLHKVYGIQSGFGGAKYEIIVMEAHTKARASQTVGGQQASSSLSAASDNQRSEAVNLEPSNNAGELVITGYTYTDLWLGDIRKPKDLLVFVQILQHLAKQVNERHDLIGNWLYCLRSRDPPPSQVAGRRRRKRSGIDENEEDEEDASRHLPGSKWRGSSAARRSTGKENRSTRVPNDLTSQARNSGSVLKYGLRRALLRELASTDHVSKTMEWISRCAHEADMKCIGILIVWDGLNSVTFTDYRGSAIFID